VKTIAISIDDSTLEAIDRLVRQERPSGAGRRKGARRCTRSEIVRAALQAFVAGRERLRREVREGAILARHRALLTRQATALVAEQAEP